MTWQLLPNPHLENFALPPYALPSCSSRAITRMDSGHSRPVSETTTCSIERLTGICLKNEHTFYAYHFLHQMRSQRCREIQNNLLIICLGCEVDNDFQLA